MFFGLFDLVCRILIGVWSHIVCVGMAGSAPAASRTPLGRALWAAPMRALLLVGDAGLEPAASRTPCARASHLRQSPMLGIYRILYPC